jgi:hypothetical protein
VSGRGVFDQSEQGLHAGRAVVGGLIGVGANARDDVVHEGRVEARAARVRLPKSEHFGEAADDGFVGIAVFDFEVENLFEMLQ